MPEVLPNQVLVIVLYIYRVSHFVGSAAETNIVFDKKKIVELENGSFIYIPTVPGSHTVDCHFI